MVSPIRRATLLLAFLLSLVTARIVRAEDVADPGIQPLKVAALREFRGKIAGQSFAVDEAQLKRLIDAELGTRPVEGAHPFVKREQLLKPLERHFDAVFNQTLELCAREQDKTGRFKLFELMQKDLGPDSQQRRDARTRFDQFERNGLAKLLLDVQAKIAADQLAILNTKLTQKYLNQLLTVEDIERAHTRKQPDALATAILNGIVRDQAEPFQRRLFDRVRNDFFIECRNVVLDGMQQLEVQREVFNDELKAHTPAGMRLELRERLDSLAKKQAKAAETSSGNRRSYGVFPSVAKLVESTVGQRQNERINRALREQQSSATFTKDQRGQLEAAVKSDVSAHFQIANSRKLLEPQFLKFAGIRRDAALSQLVAAAQSAKVQHDDTSPAGLTAFRNSLDECLQSAGSMAQQTWNEIRGKLLDQFGGTLLSELRLDIARAEVAHRCPELKNWMPDEKTIALERSAQLTPAELQQLPLWHGAAPATKQVLDETWRIVGEQVQGRLAIGSAAFQGQVGSVENVRPDMASLIAKGRDRGAEYWIGKYTSAVEADWRRKETAATRAYGELFKNTHKRIQQEVHELLKIRSPEPPSKPQKITVDPKPSTFTPAIPAPTQQPSSSRNNSPAAHSTPDGTSHKPSTGGGSGARTGKSSGAATGPNLGGGDKLGDGAGQELDDGGGGGGGAGQGGGGAGGPRGGASPDVCECCGRSLEQSHGHHGHKEKPSEAIAAPWWVLVLLLVSVILNFVQVKKWVHEEYR